MKSVNAAVSNAIRTAYDINAIPRLIAEWNHNRYANNISVDNDPSDDTDGYDIEMFPVESLIKPNRPTAGVQKARVDEARVADPYSQYDGKSRSARYYMGSVDDIYKYWTSPWPTNGSGLFPTDANGTMVRPFVLYPDGVDANKIVVGFEDTWAQPNAFDIRVRAADGTTWTVASSSPVINSKGQAILYWNGSNWSSNRPASQVATTVITGVQVRITSLKGVAGGSVSGANSHANVIEISARREHNLTDRLVGVSDTFDMSEKSLVYPLGTITSNNATLTMFNGDGIFNNESPDSPYKGLIEPNVTFNLEYVFTVGGVQYPVQQFKMYGGPWMGQRDETVSIELADFSKYFQEVKPLATSYLDMSAPELIWRVCDSVGFVDYEIQTDDITTLHKIPVWWTDGEKTVWEVFDEIAKATQTAIYFDGNGKLQVRTRTNAFQVAATPSWTLRGEDAGTELADITSLAQSDEVEANSIKVSFQQTDVDPIVNGIPKTQVLWQPEDTVALRACPLLKTLEVVSTYISLPPGEAKIWPFEGMVNIQGELIKYSGKQFIYYEGATRKSVVVKSQEEMEKYNNITDFNSRHKNHYTGALKITERGTWNSEAKRHAVEAEGYNVRNVVNGVRNTGVSGFRHKKAESRVYLNPPPRLKSPADVLLATRGAEVDSGFYYYGTRMRFEKGGGKHQRAGIVFHNNSTNEDGYYVELMPSAKLATGKQRAKRNELAFFTRNNGKWVRHGKGTALAITEGIDYEVDITYKTSGSDHVITVWVNGKNCFTKTLSGTDKNPFGGKFGLFARGDSRVSFEYLYAIRRQEEEPADDFSFLDKVEGGYTGGQFDREWVYRWRTQRRRVKKRWVKEQSRWNQQFFDEFGPIVHEVREFDVKFDPKPAISSRLYMGNDYSIICPEYSADSFSARFYVANTSRSTAIAHGEDTMKYAGQSTAVNPIMAVIGRSITVSESESVESKNETQIRKRGAVEVEISSPWIQKKEMAQELADWIKDHWSEGADEQTVTIYGNPLIELGDVVAVEYPNADMTAATHKYFVVGVSNSFDSGLETTLVLRRVIV